MYSTTLPAEESSKGRYRPYICGRPASRPRKPKATDSMRGSPAPDGRGVESIYPCSNGKALPQLQRPPRAFSRRLAALTANVCECDACAATTRSRGRISMNSSSLRSNVWLRSSITRRSGEDAKMNPFDTAIQDFLTHTDDLRCIEPPDKSHRGPLHIQRPGARTRIVVDMVQTQPAGRMGA